MLLGPLVDRVSGRTGQAGLELSSQESGVLPGPQLDYITGVRPDTWVQTCLIEVALLRLGFHWGFPTSYLDPKAYLAYSPKGIFVHG